ncbi:hypothetical protein DLR63_19200 [Vibrio tarriae]|nr:hypothetical protein DLR63_19200 [Vibrio tarriae]
MPNARLRGWQRITTKLKHNNHNHCGSLGLETPRVDSPFEAFVRHRMPVLATIFPFFHCHHQQQNQ